ncbi:hypothetical protein C8F04DRAFT_537060 [Mycena alexandri]|uniref:Uncharacterized protein n=1 Tax=Mycena alexandri TaxID=1745969 RepID=A0AAD6X561_9AGAR|nr:hypothetical protein C8F04DRAFT_537060 [Mycena alexandri]
MNFLQHHISGGAWISIRTMPNPIKKMYRYKVRSSHMLFVHSASYPGGTILFLVLDLASFGREHCRIRPGFEYLNLSSAAFPNPDTSAFEYNMSLPWQLSLYASRAVRSHAPNLLRRPIPGHESVVLQSRNQSSSQPNLADSAYLLPQRTEKSHIAWALLQSWFRL